jgi:methionyl-tRNA formyltransferase
VLQPQRAREESFIAQLRNLQPELIAVAAYGQFLPQSILDLPRFGCLNVHTSLLPKYRGAAPIQWAVLNGDTETGVTIMKMNAGMDTGDIVSQERTPIGPSDTSETLHDRLAILGAALLARTIPDYVAGRIQPSPQPADGVSHAPKIRKTDGQIDWTDTAIAIWNRIRAMTPWPGAFTHLPGPDGDRSHLLKIWDAEPSDTGGPAGEILRVDREGLWVGCGEGSLRVHALQREGSRRMTVQEFLSGHPLTPGTQFRHSA